MKPSLSLLLVASGFFLGFFMRPKPADSVTSEGVEASVSKFPSAAKNSKVSDRSPQNISVVSSEQASVAGEGVPGKIDIGLAIQSNDMARVYNGLLDFEYSWRARFIYSHARMVYRDEMDAINAKLIRELPVQTDGDQKYFRGKGTLKIGGHSIYVDVVYQPALNTLQSYRGDEYVHPCLQMDGYLVVDDQIIQRLDFDQIQVCGKNVYERGGFVFIGVENYRFKTGIYVNMLLFPANPMDHLSLEYLGPSSSEWKKEEQWVWAPAVPKDQEAMIEEMNAKADELGVDTRSLWSGIID